MRLLDGIRILGPDDGALSAGRGLTRRELVGAADTGDRWRFGEVVADPDEDVGTHVHPGEAEVIVILEGDVELHGSHDIAALQPGDVVVIPPDTEHGIRTPNGGRWLAVWPVAERIRFGQLIGPGIDSAPLSGTTTSVSTNAQRSVIRA